MNQQITTISFFQFSSLSNKAWNFKMMQFTNKNLFNDGLTFYRLMNSGKERGFSPFA